MTHRDEAWHGSTFWSGPGWTRVGRTWQHSGEATASVRRFVCPLAGRLAVAGRVFKLHLGGDGVVAIVRHNDREVWRRAIDGGDAAGAECRLVLEVRKGDSLRFVIDKRGTIGCDTTGWDPILGYEGGPVFQASEGFDARTQGAGGWFYESEGAVPAKPRIQGPEAFPEPPTVARTAEEAGVWVRQDWLAQRGEAAPADACADEIVRAGRILDRMAPRLGAPELAVWRERLAGWRARAGGTLDDAAYLDIRRLKRALMMSDPELDFTGILCIDNPYAHGSEAVHEIRHRTEDTATPGGRLLVIEGLNPDSPVRKLAPDGAPAAFWRPDLSFDGTRVLYCMKPADEPAYHLYEIGIDGSGRRRITRGDYNDLDPVYAPDGGIVFTTSRCNQYLRCGGSKFRMFVLARCDADGRNLYFLSANNEADFTPAFLPDGRILYTRWEYVDKEVIRIQSLWTVNPDGSGLTAFWGNQSRWPDMLLNARAIPGGPRVLFNAVGHHDVYSGPLGVIVPQEGMNYPDGVYTLTPHIPWAEVGAGPEDRVYNDGFRAPVCYGAFQTPFPVSRDWILVSARVGSTTPTHNDPDLDWCRLYLMDYDGNMELLFRGETNILHAQPIRPREPPRAVASVLRRPGPMTAADQKAEDGVLYSADVVEGSGIPRGLVKSMRVLEIESQTYGDGRRSSGAEADLYRRHGAFPKYLLSGETAVSFLLDEATKRILGTVPVGKDGSVAVRVPPVRSIYFQLLDERGRCLQTMRSFTHVMPGEVRGCVGCHEMRPVATPAATYAAAAPIEPRDLTPPPWGDETVSFPRFVQPVLDRHCTGCHGGEAPKAGLDLTHRAEPGTLLSWPYVLLVFGRDAKTVADLPRTSIAGPIFPYHVYPNPGVKYPTQDTVVPPMTAMSYRSPLIRLATSGEHHDVRVSPEEEARLVAWVDTLCPYLGLEEILEQPDMPPEDYFAQAVHQGLSYPARMRTAPMVHRAFRQDGFETQADRVPKDAAGNDLPSLEVVNGRRIYRIPTPTLPATPLAAPAR